MSRTTLKPDKLDKDIANYEKLFGRRIGALWYADWNEDNLRRRVREALRSRKPDPELDNALDSNNLSMPVPDPDEAGK